MPVFFRPNDYRYYLDLLKHWSKEAALDIWAYCLMPNHVHIIGIPENENSLRLAMSQVHRRYTNMINKREGWSGHLWQGRFLSYPIDNDPYLLSAVRYIELNPVHGKIVNKPSKYEWSSARAHLRNVTNPILHDQDLRSMITNWEDYLQQDEHKNILTKIAKQSGDSYFL